MQIKMGQQNSERSQVIKKSSVVIGPLKRESELLDSDGNTIDRRTKQIIKSREQN